MNIISHLISENLIYTFGWTIIHSIWQGAAVAFGFALLMFLMRRYSSRTRYIIGVMTLMLILAMSTVTFVSIYHPGTQGNMKADQSDRSKVALSGVVEVENLANPGKQSFFKDYFNQHLPLVVTIWFLGVLVLVLRFAGGFLYNKRIKVHHTRTLSTFWQNRLKKLCLQANIRKSVRLVESALAKVPIVIGHFKPVILLPLGLVTGLPQEQVEALLAHELAHISRKDYLVNILQNVVDILFFYHPGVRWISSHIRSEREHCCDDIAVSVSGDSVNFARALTNIQGYGLKNANPAMAATGKTPGSYGLLNRIKRLVGPRKNTIGSEFTEGFIGAFILGICILALVVSANAAAALNMDMIKTSPSTVGSKTSSQDFTLEMDTNLEIGGKLKSEWDVHINCRLVDVKTNQTVWQLKEDKIKKGKGFFSFKDKVFLKKGKYKWHVPKNCIDLYARMSGESAKTSDEFVSHITFEDEKEMADEETINDEKTVEDEVTLEDEEEMEIALEKHEKELMSHEKEMEKALQKQEEELERRKQELKRHEEELKRHEKEMEIVLKKQEKEMKKEKLKMESEMRKVNKELQKVENELQKTGKKLKKEESFLNTLKKELFSDKLIDDEEEFELKLTEKQLIINGKTQSRAVFEKYKKLYESHKGRKIKSSDKFHIICSK
jgi:beta-lactamase regulating signal transducer with metallopeptidase domain